MGAGTELWIILKILPSIANVFTEHKTIVESRLDSYLAGGGVVSVGREDRMISLYVYLLFRVSNN